MFQRLTIPTAMVLFLLGSHAERLNAGPKVRIGKSVDRGSRIDLQRIDHHDWNQLLKRYVDLDGNVDYTAWKGSTSDAQLLRRYIHQLSMAKFSGTTDQRAQLAFWINAYNAVTVHGILREYPTTSIRNHTSRFGGYNIWKDLLVHVDGRDVSLEDIEHKILRQMGEPRIHFAIVCASKSCPRLLDEAYTAELLDEQLTRNASAFFTDARHFRYDAQRQRFHLSSILKWFGSDFGADQSEQLRAIAPYLLPGKARQAARQGQGKVWFPSYDWNLNDRADAQKAAR